MRDDFADYYATHLDAPLPDQHPYLLGVTREEALAQEGSYVSRLFAYMPPRFYFKPQEQEVLVLALQDVSDDETAAQLFTSKETIRKRWKSICEKAEEIMPALLPARAEAGRGPEKRRCLLRYLREHSEELRPLVPRK